MSEDLTTPNLDFTQLGNNLDLTTIACTGDGFQLTAANFTALSGYHFKEPALTFGDLRDPVELLYVGINDDHSLREVIWRQLYSLDDEFINDAIRFQYLRDGGMVEFGIALRDPKVFTAQVDQLIREENSTQMVLL